MQKESDIQFYAVIMTCLLLTFCFRVGAQLLQAFYPVVFLPAFEEWHSGALPYPALVASQALIIILFSTVVWRFRKGTVKVNGTWGKAMLAIGALYFSFMLLRLIAGLTFASGHSWFDATIPTIFHLVLASFILVYGHYHYKYGKL